MKPLRISELASEELRCLSHSIELIEAYPEIGEERRGRHPSRQFSVLGFPYKVVYRICPQDTYVVAVAHTSRRPGYWKNRG